MRKPSPSRITPTGRGWPELLRVARTEKLSSSGYTTVFFLFLVRSS